MGMFDWLSEPIGQGSQTTWGQLFGQALQYSNTNSGKALGLFAQQYFKQPGQQGLSGSNQQGNVSVFSQPYSSVLDNGSYLTAMPASPAGAGSNGNNTSVQDVSQIMQAFSFLA